MTESDDAATRKNPYQAPATAHEPPDAPPRPVERHTPADERESLLLSRVQTGMLVVGVLWLLVGAGGLLGVSAIYTGKNFPPLARWESRHYYLAGLTASHFLLCVAAVGSCLRKPWALIFGVVIIVARAIDVLPRMNPLVLSFFAGLAVLGLAVFLGAERLRRAGLSLDAGPLRATDSWDG